jgi:hypothetical protein
MISNTINHLPRVQIFPDSERHSACGGHDVGASAAPSGSRPSRIRLSRHPPATDRVKRYD